MIKYQNFEDICEREIEITRQEENVKPKSKVNSLSPIPENSTRIIPRKIVVEGQDY